MMEFTASESLTLRKQKQEALEESQTSVLSAGLSALFYLSAMTALAQGVTRFYATIEGVKQGRFKMRLATIGSWASALRTR